MTAVLIVDIPLWCCPVRQLSTNVTRSLQAYAQGYPFRRPAVALAEFDLCTAAFRSY